MPWSSSETTNLIRYKLSQLRAENGHHTFENLCRHYSRLCIAGNILPATGPVAGRGDQGRDFETFRTLIRESVDHGFGVVTDDECIVFACTLQQRNLPRKIRTDVDAVMHGAPVTSIYVFCEADVQVGERHALQKWAVDTHRVRLEIIDGTGLAEALSTAEMFPIAREHLGLPRSMAPRHRSRLWLIVAVVLSLVGGSVVAWESWKAEPPPAVHLSTVAGTASWTSRAGQIEFNGNDPSNDDGYVAPAVEDLEDGTVRAGGLIMHPSWENYGFIRGCFQLSEPLAANDRFRSRAGFIREYADAGNVRFRVTVADNKGNVRIVADETDDRANEQMVEFDLSLADYAGLSTLCIEVLANGDAGQDAAFWHDPRIVSSANHL